MIDGRRKTRLMQCMIRSVITLFVTTLAAGIPVSDTTQTARQSGDYHTADCVTAAAVVFRDADGFTSRYGVLTAGHCPFPDDAVIQRWTSGPHDLAIVAEDTAAAPDTGGVGGERFDAGVGFGDGMLCKSATGVTGAQCGPVLDTQYTPVGGGWSPDAGEYVVVGDTVCLPGDSGGGWYVQGGPQSGVFFGVTSGGLGAYRQYPARSCIVSRFWDIPWDVISW